MHKSLVSNVVLDQSSIHIIYEIRNTLSPTSTMVCEFFPIETTKYDKKMGGRHTLSMWNYYLTHRWYYLEGITYVRADTARTVRQVCFSILFLHKVKHLMQYFVFWRSELHVSPNSVILSPLHSIFKSFFISCLWRH